MQTDSINNNKSSKGKYVIVSFIILLTITFSMFLYNLESYNKVEDINVIELPDILKYYSAEDNKYVTYSYFDKLSKFYFGTKFNNEIGNKALTYKELVEQNIITEQQAQEMFNKEYVIIYNKYQLQYQNYINNLEVY